MGGQCLARSARDRDRLDLGRGGKAARDPAQLDGLRAASLPPCRAYLKLWEALTLIGWRPGPGERCFDLGSSPGGWSWALQRMDTDVVSVDKAPLAPAVARLPGIEHRLESAFALDPRTLGPV